MKVVMNCCDYIESSSAAAPYYNNPPPPNPASPPQQPYQPQHCNNYPPPYESYHHQQQHSSFYYQQQQQPKANMSASLGLQSQPNYHNNYYYSQHYNGYNHHHHQQQQQHHPLQQQDYYGSHYNNIHQYSSNSYNSGGYVYNPQEARVRKAQREQSKLTQRVARQRKNSGHVDQEESPPPHMMRHPCLPRNGPPMMPPFGAAHPHKVFHGSAAAAVSANEMRGLGGPAAVQHAYGASPPPPQRFYPAPYVDHAGYYSNHHQLPAWFAQQPHYHTPQHHQMQPNALVNRSSVGRDVSYMNQHYLPPHPVPHQPQQHQLLAPNNEQEEDLNPMPPHVMASQYEVEGTASHSAASDTNSQETKEADEKKPSPVESENPDSQPLPPFQHAFGSTEIGRFAHEGFSAQDDEEETELELEIVEMEEGEFLIPAEGESFIIECSSPDDAVTTETSVVVLHM